MQSKKQIKNHCMIMAEHKEQRNVFTCQCFVVVIYKAEILYNNLLLLHKYRHDIIVYLF